MNNIYIVHVYVHMIYIVHVYVHKMYIQEIRHIQYVHMNNTYIVRDNIKHAQTHTDTHVHADADAGADTRRLRHRDIET